MSEQKPSLSASMSVSEFDSAYFYAKDLKVFAKTLGIRVGNFRKIELEALIREFLALGNIPDAQPVLPRKQGQSRDQLSSEKQVINYVGDKKTKAFLLELVKAEDPNVKAKSGQWYWLNDWRRKQQETKTSFTYQDVANKLLELMQTAGRLPQIPSARMNNFITDFRADPTNSCASREQIMAAWEHLKGTSGPKTYEAYKGLKSI
ncbi:MAG: hypothetical protein ABJO09_02800 [Hyphomicrobiales bacterium]